MATAADMDDTVPLHEGRQLFLKTIARMIIIVQLPEIKVPGSSISNWEVMERLKTSICPHVFSYLKVSKTTMEFLHFEAEAESKELLSKLIAKLDARSIKLSGFPEPMKVKAGKAKIKFPKKHDWVAFFRDSQVMDESKHGERPDTIHVQGLPFKWFAVKGETRPCEQIIRDIFSKYGPLRAVDIPVLDPYRNRMDISVSSSETGFKTFSFGSSLYFEVYVQFMDYTGFEKAMQAFKGKKLVHSLEDGKTAAVNIIIEFDKTAHLSENNIKRRNAQRQKLINDDLRKLEIARKIEEEERLRREMEHLDELRKEEERKREQEQQKQKDQLKRQIMDQKRKLKRIKKKIFIHVRKREEEIDRKRMLELIALRKTQAINLMTVILNRLKEKKVIEKRDIMKRKKELKRLQQLEEKKLMEEKQIMHQIQKEKENRKRLQKKEKSLRKKLLQKLEVERK